MRRLTDANTRLRKDNDAAVAQLDEVRKQMADMRSQMQAEVRVMRAWNASQGAVPAAAAAAGAARADESAFVEDEAVT